jgi:Immunoglobulin domain
VDGSAYILGDTNTTVLATVGKPTTLRCLAGGYPKPFVTWWRGDKILPLKDDRIEITRDYSLILNRVDIVDLGPYVCQGKYRCGLFFLVIWFSALTLSYEFSLQLNWSSGLG